MSACTLHNKGTSKRLPESYLPPPPYGAMIYKILLTLFFVSVAHAEPRYWGIDQLGGAKYVEVMVQNHPDGFALGIFTQKDLFGDGFAAVDKVLAKRRVPLVRYNLRWSDAHAFSKKDFPAIVKEAQRGLYVVNKYPAVECEFSGATEHQLNAADATELARQVLRAIPERCTYVNNPWTGRGAFIVPGPRIKNEVHGADARKPNVGGRYNWSADGSDVFDINITGIKQRLNDADVFFFWTSQNNGRRNAADSTPRPQRQFWPTGNLMKMQAYLATAEGPVSLPRQYLVKPKADQHMSPPEPRALKPVLIVPNGTKRLSLKSQLRTFEGEGPQPFADGRVRFYFPKFGYEMGSNLDVVANGKKVGVCNPGFRAGAFR